MTPTPQPDIWNIVSILLSSAATIGALVLGYLQWKRPPRPKSQETLDTVDASSKVVGDALQLKDAYREQIETLQKELAVVRQEVATLSSEVKRIPVLEKENVALKEENLILREEVEALRIRIRAIESKDGV
jgi:hypothetical protein